MRSTRIVLIGLLALTGCEHLPSARKVDNPVMPPPPPRISQADRPAGASDHELAHVSARADGNTSSIRSAAALRGQAANDGELLPPTKVVATVNGVPIFASDVLGPYERQLQAAKLEAEKPDGKVSLEQLRQIQEGIIKRDLENHVKRTLLVHSLKSTLPSEQLKMLESHLDAEFEKRTLVMREKMGINSKHELDLKMQESGTSLENERQNFIQGEMAMQFLEAKAQTTQSISRRDMYEYYQAHFDDYAIPSQVKWQQIQIGHSRAGGKSAARRLMDQAVAELREGADFASVARKYSHGVTASSGGHWDWTAQGSLADAKLEKTLFSMRRGTQSEILEGERAYELVRVIDRKDASRVPFAEVQDEIKKKLQDEGRRGAPRKILDELLAGAVIETMFDAE
jgi:hypothetical protein